MNIHTRKMYFETLNSDELQMLFTCAIDHNMLQDDFIFLLPRDFKGISLTEVEWKDLYTILKNTKLLNEYIEIRKDLDYINDVEQYYIDESPEEYSQLMDKEYDLRMAILNKMKQVISMDASNLKKQIESELVGARKDLEESRIKGYVDDMEYNFGYIDAMKHILFIIDNEQRVVNE